MIPLLVPPLTDLNVLVTRPAHQAHTLCAQIQQLGGVAISIPVLEIKPFNIALPAQVYDLIIFISANAVSYGLDLLQSQVKLASAVRATVQIAAVGHATAAALAHAGFPASIIAAPPANSESLLAHEVLQTPPSKILLVRGKGGRELLRDTLQARGSNVDVLEVYERVPTVDSGAHAELIKALRDGMDVITITSVDVLHALDTLLDAKLLDLNERARVRQLTVLAGSSRIAAQLPASGWHGEYVIAASPEDAALLTALTRWYTRGRN